MTPSNANTSGLAPCPFCGGAPFDCGFRRWECGSCGAQGPAGSKADATNGWNRRVTAASAQARIADEQAKAYAERQCTIEENRLRLAAEARADRLAKALERIEGYDWPVIVGHDVQTSVGQATGAVYENKFPIARETALSAFNQVKAIARAALQQETQP